MSHIQDLQVNGQHVKQEGDNMIATYAYNHTTVEEKDGKFIATPNQVEYQFKTETKVPKTGIMFVGLGGNNGTTFTAGQIANKHNITWYNKKGLQQPNYYGSITQASTTKIGCRGTEEIYLPMNKILPLVNPDDLVIGGWDISALPMSEAMKRAEVLDYNLIENLQPHMKDMVPLPAIYYPDFIASNQETRADNILKNANKIDDLNQIRADIRKFKQDNNLEKVLVLWTANTERFCEVETGVHDNIDNLMKAIENNHAEISPSTVYAVATILEGCSYINGSPQNTLVPGVIQLAKKNDVFIVGDDFKSGQTKIKTALADFFIHAGIKQQSVVSYNHLGNNDGKNLSSERQFKSKEISKKSCIDDILASNKVLFPESTKIDHEIIIKYVPFTGDSKKAIDEYMSSIFLNGNHTLVLYNVCEDSLLAAPIILDLVLLTEIFERIHYKTPGQQEFQRFNKVLSTLGYLCKAPLTDFDCPLVNSLGRQKDSLNNIFKACAGLHADDNLLLEFRCPVGKTGEKLTKEEDVKQEA